MRLIAHRGNKNGPNKEMENRPEYILDTLSLGYNCEIDVRYIGEDFYLGHDDPDYIIEIDFLLRNSNSLWIHCKNIEALHILLNHPELNIFWHQDDNYTLTSKNYIWCSPNMDTTKKSIIVMPEWHNFEISNNAFGVCSDYIYKIEDMIKSKVTSFTSNT